MIGRRPFAPIDFKGPLLQALLLLLLESYKGKLCKPKEGAKIKSEAYLVERNMS